MATLQHSSSRIIHLSDIHCTTNDYVYELSPGNVPIVRGPDQDTRAKCAEFVDFLTTSAGLLRTDQLLITGDFVDGNRDEYYALALECLLEPLRDFGYDITIAPGNHDYWNYGVQFMTDQIAEGRTRCHEWFSSYFKTPTVDGYPIDLDLGGGNHLIVLDSMKGHYDVSTGSHMSQGNIGGQQNEWLRTTLPAYQRARDGGAKIAVAMHHFPFPMSNEQCELTDAVEFLDAIRDLVDALIFGHSGPPHWFYEDQSRQYGIPIITGANTDHMSDSGYPVSVIDLGCNQVEVYSTRGGPVVVEVVPEFRYGSRGESALIELAQA